MVRLLVEKGADVNAEGGEYSNALQAAARHSHEALVQLLVENSMNINAEGEGLERGAIGLTFN